MSIVWNPLALSKHPVARWWLVGILFTAWGLGALYVLKDRLGMPLLAATLIAAEVGTVLRFLVNDHWVFGYARPTFGRLWQFHIANVVSFVIWWTVGNTLPLFGMHYLLASVAATACSVGISMLTNFLWIWRGRGAAENSKG